MEPHIINIFDISGHFYCCWRCSIYSVAVGGGGGGGAFGIYRQIMDIIMDIMEILT